MSSAKGKGFEYTWVNHGNSYQDLEFSWRKRYWGVRGHVDKAHDGEPRRTWSCWEEPWANSQQRTKTSVLQPQKAECYQQHSEFETWPWTPERECIAQPMPWFWSQSKLIRETPKSWTLIQRDGKLELSWMSNFVVPS